MMVSEKREEIVFHFNKMHIQDPSVPMWTIKHKGNTYYVHHVEVDKGVGFKTKETPDNPHTKGSLKFRARLKITNEDGMIVGKIF
jgi:hypothetical protein